MFASIHVFLEKFSSSDLMYACVFVFICTVVYSSIIEFFYTIFMCFTGI